MSDLAESSHDNSDRDELESSDEKSTIIKLKLNPNRRANNVEYVPVRIIRKRPREVINNAAKRLKRTKETLFHHLALVNKLISSAKPDTIDVVEKGANAETSITGSENGSENGTGSETSGTSGTVSEKKIQLKNINNSIEKMPSKKELLSLKMPFKTKCSIMEKIIILNHIQPFTFQHLNLKNSINDEIEKYKKCEISASDYDNYNILEQLLDETKSDIPIKYRILGSAMSYQNKLAVYKKFKYYDRLSECNSEHAKLSSWLECALNLPTTIKKIPISISDGNIKINEFLTGVRASLDSKIYALDSVKQQILIIINNMITNPESRGLGMALVGPQGVGKTELANALADAVKLPFSSISLGGVNDVSALAGHSYTYEASIPGAIVNSIIKMKQLNGIMFFDELDKIGDTAKSAEVNKLLIHITDSTQNNNYKDRYLGSDISIDLSNIWFVYSLNYIESLDKTLRDRIPIVFVDGYSKAEKKNIAKIHLLPGILKNIGLKPGDMEFADDALDFIITKTNELYSRETKSEEGKSGVRQLKNIISNIVMKLNMCKNCILEDGTFGSLVLPYNIADFTLPFVINLTHIKKLDVISLSKENLSMYL